MEQDVYNDPEHQKRLEHALETAERVEIPDLLHSEYSGAPFERCVDCGVNLLLPHAPTAPDQPPPLGYYQIAKHFVDDESVFEFALCRVCSEELQSEFSEKTRMALFEFIRERQSFMHFSFDPKVWLSCCRFCQKSRGECRRFSISGVCVQASLILGPGPVMVCEECELECNELISEQTRKRWDRFVDDNFDFPPGVDSQSPSNHPILI
ncbi:MAG: hypothetical protein CMJ78_27435 [Planctomycetaceae bacterium]|nr:hypothetical protein [Planctomycetaceae bacterium]